jgi:hypothetical protein
MSFSPNYGLSWLGNRALSLLFICLLGLPALAGGAIRLEGKIKSFDSDTIVVASAGQNWTLERKKLAPDLRKKLASIKSGASFDAWIDFNAVSNVSEPKIQ